MSLDSETEYRQGYLYVKTKGSFDFHLAKAVLVNALNSAYEHDLHGVLFDGREMTGTMTTMQRYDLAKHMSGIVTGFLLKKKSVLVHIAYVGFPPILDLKKFGGTVAKNRGVSLLVTDNYDEAVSWLENKVKADL